MKRLQQLREDWRPLVLAAVAVPAFVALSFVPPPTLLKPAGLAVLLAVIAAGATVFGVVLVVGRLLLERELAESPGRVRRAAVFASILGATLWLVGSTLTLELGPRVATAPVVVAWLASAALLFSVWRLRRSRPLIRLGVSFLVGFAGMALFLAPILWVFFLGGVWRAQALAVVLALIALLLGVALTRASDDGLDSLSTSEWAVLSLIGLAAGVRAVTVVATRGGLHGQLQSLFITLAGGVILAVWVARAMAPAIYWRDARRRALTVAGVGLGVLAMFRAVAAPWSGPAGELPPIKISRETTHITEPLRADGTPDYAAWINRHYGEGVTPDNNAAVLLAPVLNMDLGSAASQRLGIEENADHPTLIGGLQDALAVRHALESRGSSLAEVADFEDTFRGQHIAARQGPWREHEHPLADAWLEINEEALAQVERASRRPRFWLTVYPNDMAPSTPRPSLLGLRSAANALVARSWRSLGMGDWDSAARDAVTVQRLAWLTGQDPLLISRLVAVAIRGVGVGLVPSLAAKAPRGSKRAEQLLEELSALEDLPGTVEALDQGERALLLGEILSLRQLSMTAGSGAWIDQLEPLDLLARLGAKRSRSMRTLYSIDPRAIDWSRALQIVNRRFDANVAMMAEPEPRRRAELERAYEKEFEWLSSSPITPPLGFDGPSARDRVSCLLDPACLFAAYEPTRLMVRAVGLRSVFRAAVSWNECQAQYRLALRSLELAIERASHDSYPTELDLRSLDGYTYRYHPGPAIRGRPDRVARFAITTEPVTVDETGVRAFCVDGGGRLHQELDGSAPDVVEGRCVGGTPVQ